MRGQPVPGAGPPVEALRRHAHRAHGADGAVGDAGGGADADRHRAAGAAGEHPVPGPGPAVAGAQQAPLQPLHRAAKVDRHPAGTGARWVGAFARMPDAACAPVEQFF